VYDSFLLLFFLSFFFIVSFFQHLRLSFIVFTNKEKSRVSLCSISALRPDGIGTVLRDEWDKFLEIKDRMRQFLEHQITNFR